MHVDSISVDNCSIFVSPLKGTSKHIIEEIIAICINLEELLEEEEYSQGQIFV